MRRSIARAVAVALFGALAGPVWLVLASALHPQVEFPIHRLPPLARGVYAPEQVQGQWFVWTSGRVQMRLEGLDRRAGWTCTVQFRGARPPGFEQPHLSVELDGVPVVARLATNDFQRLEVVVPPRPGERVLLLGLVSSPTFVPASGDTRALGVQLNELGCRPARGDLVLPPHRALWAAATSAALLGAAFGLAGITAGSAVGGTMLVAAGQSLPMTVGSAQYTAFPDTMISLAAWIALCLALAIAVVRALNRKPLRNTARFAILYSGGVLYLQLLALLHPVKSVVDAVFHAHRFEWVLAGHWYFTQLSTSATPFPYAIGLYLFAAPGSLLTSDHVALLRIVVSACHAIAGALLYVMVVRSAGSRLTGAMAAGLFALVPASYPIVGNANLTNAFGAAAVVVTMAAATVWPLDLRRPWYAVALVALATLAFISHVSSLVILLATLSAMAFFYVVLGRRTLRAPAAVLVLCTALALLLSVAIYWGHFGSVYRAQLSRATATAAAPAREETAMDSAAEPRPSGVGHTQLGLDDRVTNTARQTVEYLGWPVLVLSLAGAWQWWSAGQRDRLQLAVFAYVTVCAALVLFSTIAPGSVRYQQDAFEFIGRVEHATAAGFVILAAAGAAWAWQAGLVARIVASALVIVALVEAIRLWRGWI